VLVGLFVQTVTDLQFGYDIDQLALDRDRRHCDDNDLGNAITRVWSAALIGDVDPDEPDFKFDCEKLLQAPPPGDDAAAVKAQKQHASFLQLVTFAHAILDGQYTKKEMHCFKNLEEPACQVLFKTWQTLHPKDFALAGNDKDDLYLVKEVIGLNAVSISPECLEVLRRGGAPSVQEAVRAHVAVAAEAEEIEPANEEQACQAQQIRQAMTDVFKVPPERIRFKQLPDSDAFSVVNAANGDVVLSSRLLERQRAHQELGEDLCTDGCFCCVTTVVHRVRKTLFPKVSEALVSNKLRMLFPTKEEVIRYIEHPPTSSPSPVEGPLGKRSRMVWEDTTELSASDYDPESESDEEMAAAPVNPSSSEAVELQALLQDKEQQAAQLLARLEDVKAEVGQVKRDAKRRIVMLKEDMERTSVARAILLFDVAGLRDRIG
jgi:hypothetical protein